MTDKEWAKVHSFVVRENAPPAAAIAGEVREVTQA